MNCKIGEAKSNFRKIGDFETFKDRKMRPLR
jgi:hypothetical protein